MAELFPSFAALKAHVGGGITTSLQLDSIAPAIADTARRHLTPYLGAYYHTLVAAHAANTLSSAQQAILPFVQRPLALLTIHEYSKVGGIEFGEGGYTRTETEYRKAAFKYQENLHREYFLEKGYDALEEMLIELQRTKANHAAWSALPEAKQHLRSLFNYARDFRIVLNTQCDRYTFETLRPLIAEVLDSVLDCLPDAYADDLINRYESNTASLNTAELAALTLLRKAIGRRVMHEATQRHWVQVKGGRVFVVEEFGEQGATNRTTPTQAGGGLLTTYHIGSDKYMELWLKYIRTNAGSFPLVFNTTSGGSNTDADAWHIPTAADKEQAEQDKQARLKQAIYRF